MADHIRTQIRDFAIGASVLGNLATSAARVYKDRTTSLDDAELGAGAIVVYMGSEDNPEVGSLYRGSRRMIHKVPLHVNCYQKTSGDFAKALDTMEKEVDVKLLADKTMGGLAKDIEKGESEREDEGDLEKPAGCRRLVFWIEYHTLDTAPDQALP
jgi:hypothetical protein